MRATAYIVGFFDTKTSTFVGAGLFSEPAPTSKATLRPVVLLEGYGANFEEGIADLRSALYSPINQWLDKVILGNTERGNRDRVQLGLKPIPLSTKCQHELSKETEGCRHGYAFGTTCRDCILSCRFCWDLYSSSASFGPRPTRTCNRHKDCDEADKRAKAAGRFDADHCHDDCCEDCFGS